SKMVLDESDWRPGDAKRAGQLTPKPKESHARRDVEMWAGSWMNERQAPREIVAAQPKVRTEESKWLPRKCNGLYSVSIGDRENYVTQHVDWKRAAPSLVVEPFLLCADRPLAVVDDCSGVVSVCIYSEDAHGRPADSSTSRLNTRPPSRGRTRSFPKVALR